jgi:hypothetical protein
VKRIRRLVSATFALAALAGPCREATPPPGPPVPTHCATALVGDSLTIQARYGDPVGVDDPAQLQVDAGLGWKVENVQQWVTDQVAAGSVDVLVVALGTNDSNPTWNGGWTSADVDRFRVLINTPHPAARVVLVLPGHGAGIDPRHAAAIDAARRDLTALAATRPGTFVTDRWQAVADTEPELISSDGIHLRAQNDAPTDDGVVRPVDPAARAERLRTYWDALPPCA